MALIFKIMEELKISRLLESVYGETVAGLIKVLISYMIIRETSAMQHYSDFVWSHLLIRRRNGMILKFQSFLRMELITHRQNCLFRNGIQPGNSNIYISYDSTNMNTKAGGVETAEFRHAKDDSGVPQVNISYAVKHIDVTPLFYEMYPGSIIDNTQGKYMVDRAKEYGYKNVDLILDRGYLSTKNIRYFDAKRYDFLVMIKTNSSLVSEMVKDAQLPLLTKAKYYFAEHDIYGLTRQGTIGDDITVRYFHIYYDNIRTGWEKNEYLKQLIKKEQHLHKKVNEKIRRKEEMVPYGKLFRLKYDNNGYLESYKRNENAIQKKTDKLGFFVIVTSKEMTVSEVLDIYRQRDSVEKIFRMLKTRIDYDTFRVHSQDSLESKTYAMFIASIVRNYLF